MIVERGKENEKKISEISFLQNTILHILSYYYINCISICLQLHVRFIYIINIHSACILNEFYLMLFYNLLCLYRTVVEMKQQSIKIF